jgi:hypothetical protein
LNRELKGAGGGRTILRTVNYFTDTGLLRGLTEDKRATVQPRRGLALVFEAVPVLEEAGTLDFDTNEASDEQGRTLYVTHSFITSMTPGDALREVPRGEKAAPHRWTVFLLPPAQDARWLRVQVVTDEIAPSDQPRKITFRDLSQPVTRPNYDMFF